MPKGSELLRRKRLVRGLWVGLGAMVFALILNGLGVVRPLEWKSWDARLRLLARPERAGQDIVIFLIDQYSLDFFEDQQGVPWPWPRQIYSAVMDYLRAGGAKAVFFDLFFSESSRAGVEDDQDMAAAMERSGNVFLALSLSQKKEESWKAAPASALERFSLAETDLPEASYPSALSASLPIDDLIGAARGAGNVLFVPDKDGIFRRLPLAESYEGLLVPSISVALAKFAAEGQKLPRVPADSSGQMIIRYHGPSGTYKSVSIASIINSWAQIEEGKEPQVPPSEFSGKIVLIGGSAPGILDNRPTPMSGVTPGVEIHATVLDNLLRRDFVRVPAFAVFLAFLLFVSFLTAIGASVLPKIWHHVVFFVVCLALPCAAVWLAFRSGYWLGFVVPEFAVVAGFIGASLLNYSVEGKQRRFIKSVFRHYLSPDVIDRVIQNPALLRLGGEKREITSFFSDVAGFTAISEALAPEELVNLLNEYLQEMTDIILSSGGTLDKYEGDAMIAFWNAPLDQPDHALRACRAALGCQKRLGELQPHFQDKYRKGVTIRIGLNSGAAVVGNMGSSRRFDYTAMGDTINLAARLEGACKQYKVPILVGEETYRRVQDDIGAREVDIVRVVGKTKPVAIYEIVGEKAGSSAAEIGRLKAYNEAREAYKRRDWERAEVLFGKIEGDALSALYWERCRALKAAPPAGEWDGVFDLKIK
jgi:adenylate cyclase